MNRTLATKLAAAACAIALCGGAALARADDAFAPGKDGTHPRIVRALPSWDSVGAAPATALYAGFWENAPAGSEPGWAIAVAPRADAIDATWFTYDADGSPMWLALHADDAASLIDGYPPQTTFVGELERAFAPPAAAAFATVAYGPAVVEFASPGVATLRYDVDGTWRTKTIVRSFAVDAIGACSPRPPFDGLWTNAAPTAAGALGGGVYVARAGERVVAAWFTFDAQGKPVWRVMAGEPADDGAYSGTLYATHGPALGAPYDATSVRVAPIGTAAVAFGDGEGVLAYDVGGTPATIDIVHDAALASSPRCN